MEYMRNESVRTVKLARGTKIQFAEKAEVSLFVRHVCACPSRHFGPVQTPSVVARASSAVDSSGCQSTRVLDSRVERAGGRKRRWNE